MAILVHMMLNRMMTVGRFEYLLPLSPVLKAVVLKLLDIQVLRVAVTIGLPLMLQLTDLVVKVLVFEMKSMVVGEVLLHGLICVLLLMFVPVGLLPLVNLILKRLLRKLRETVRFLAGVILPLKALSAIPVSCFAGLRHQQAGGQSQERFDGEVHRFAFS